MASLDEDIETVRELVVRAWEERNWLAWSLGSCVLLAWRIARALGAK